jgi:hypothetical protein
VRLREDFQERLRFAVYQEEREAQRRGTILLGRGMMMGIGVAATIAVVMAATLLREGRTTEEAAPIATRALEFRSGNRSATLFSPLPSASLTFEDLDFLTGSNVLLYENSPLFRRHREPEILMAELR